MKKMNPRHRPLLGAVCALALAALATADACAQADYPGKPVKIIVPYPPGGAVDVVTRKMAQKLTQQMGQSFIIDNKPGGTGTIGATAVARAEADGYTLWPMTPPSPSCPSSSGSCLSTTTRT
jgi:tripartite-type tricarboxylate transporter receptor subunit TctC